MPPICGSQRNLQKLLRTLIVQILTVRCQGKSPLLRIHVHTVYKIHNSHKFYVENAPRMALSAKKRIWLIERILLEEQGWVDSLDL